MEKIYSSVKPGMLLHVIHRSEDFSRGRVEISPECEFLQAGSFTIPLEKEVSPHKHMETSKTAKITQESLVVIEGSLSALYYDINNSLIFSTVLKKGDCSLTLKGGHSFKAKEETKIYEFKNGPYEGKDKDYVKI